MILWYLFFSFITLTWVSAPHYLSWYALTAEFFQFVWTQFLQRGFRYKRRIKMQSALTREPSEIELRGHWRSVTQALLTPDEIWTWTTSYLNIGIQNICPMTQKLKILIRPLLYNNSWQPSLKDKYFLSCVRVHLHVFCLYKPLFLSPGTVFWFYLKSVFPES